MILRIYRSIKRRRRLELMPEETITVNSDVLYRYRDPKTGVIYAGRGRYDPALVPSVMNELGMNLRTDSQGDTEP